MSNHKKMKGRKSGGRIAYDAKDSNVVHEAEGKKSGGAVHHVGNVQGHKGKSRVKKACGGGVGSDKNPFSSAHRG